MDNNFLTLSFVPLSLELIVALDVFKGLITVHSEKIMLVYFQGQIKFLWSWYGFSACWLQLS